MWMIIGAVGAVFGAGVMSTSAFASTYTASISTSPIDMNATAAGTGANITTNNVTVISTCPSGYTLGINSSEEDTKLYMGGDSSNGTNNNTNYIDASTGTPANPVVITGSNLNTWGYSATSSTASGTFIGLTNNIATLATSVEPTSSTGITIPVYYGVSVGTDRAAGTYQMANNGTIVYTLTTDLSCTSYQVAFNSNGGTGTMDNQWIAEDDSAPLSNNNYTGPSSTSYFAGWNTAADGTGTAYTDGQSVTNLTTPGNAITLYAQWKDCNPGYICYNDNGASSATKMGDQNVGTSATSATLWASNFQRTGYGFLGWSTKANPTIGNDTIYGPMETLEGINVSQGGLILYAVWQAAAKDGSNNPIYLQDWNGCSGLTATTYNSTTGKLTVAPDSVIALTDKRDSQVYAVAKLADGACWMIENLRLESTGTVGNNTIDPNVTNRSLAQGYGGVFNGLASAETANFSNSTTANSLYSADGSTTYTIDPETHKDANNNYCTGYYFPRYRNSNTNLADDYSTTSANANTYAYGNYYTWTAAMANTTYYTSYSASDAANTSICPSGWRLPLGASRNTINLSFSKLDYSMGGSGTTANANTDPTGAVRSKVWRSFPNNFLYSGNAYISNINGRGSFGYYWSSSASGANYAYNLILNSSALYPGTYDYTKFNGFTVRCVVAPSP